jgi:death-on-curing protein
MDFILLSTDLVERLHDAALNPGELTGRARDKSLEGALSRVEYRLAYGLLGDAFDLAAAYCVAVAQGHCFNDGNKRTAFRVMDAALVFNGITPSWITEDVGQIIIQVAQRLIDDATLAEWLRDNA